MKINSLYLRHFAFVSLLFFLWGNSALAQGFQVLVTSGVCSANSHIAEGVIGDDLTKHRTPFECDSVVVTSFDPSGDREMITFSEKESIHDPILSFSGVMQMAQSRLVVERVYFQSGISIPATAGYCFFGSFGATGIEISCTAEVDQEGRRAVPFVDFKAGS